MQKKEAQKGVIKRKRKNSYKTNPINWKTGRKQIRINYQ